MYYSTHSCATVQVLNWWKEEFKQCTLFKQIWIHESKSLSSAQISNIKTVHFYNWLKWNLKQCTVFQFLHIRVNNIINLLYGTSGNLCRRLFFDNYKRKLHRYAISKLCSSTFFIVKQRSCQDLLFMLNHTVHSSIFHVQNQIWKKAENIK